jgi:hypothetical protein
LGYFLGFLVAVITYSLFDFILSIMITNVCISVLYIYILKK